MENIIKYFFIFNVLTFIFTFLTFDVKAQAIPDGSYLGEYYLGMNLNEFVFSRNDASVDFSWVEGSPDPRITDNNFSVRWQGRFNFDESWYQFDTLSDDGIRVFVDGETVVNAWRHQDGATFSGKIFLNQGMHLVRVEYFEGMGGAGVRVNWDKTSPPPTPTPTNTPIPTVTSRPNLTPVPTSTPRPSVLGVTTSNTAASSTTTSGEVVRCLSLTASPEEGPKPLTVELNGSGTATGGIQIYRFNLGDPSEGEARIVDTNKNRIIHTYSGSGIYTAGLQIIDNSGNVSEENEACKAEISVMADGEVLGDATESAQMVEELPKTGINLFSVFGIGIGIISAASFGTFLLRRFKLSR